MMNRRYQSITTSEILHDAANMLAEFIFLNSNILAKSFPWKGEKGKDWSKIVSALKKLMKDPYGLSAEQLAFYIWHCKPRFINPAEFAKMAVVARKLFGRYDIDQVAVLYSDKRRELAASGIENATYKQEKSKSLLSFLRELESGKEKNI